MSVFVCNYDEFLYLKLNIILNFSDSGPVLGKKERCVFEFNVAPLLIFVPLWGHARSISSMRGGLICIIYTVHIKTA